MTLLVPGDAVASPDLMVFGCVLSVNTDENRVLLLMQNGWMQHVTIMAALVGRERLDKLNKEAH